MTLIPPQILARLLAAKQQPAIPNVNGVPVQNPNAQPMPAPMIGVRG